MDIFSANDAWNRAAFVHERASGPAPGELPARPAPHARAATGAWTDAGAFREAVEQILEDRCAGEPLPSFQPPPAAPGTPAQPFFPGFLRPFLQAGAARLRAGLRALGARFPLTGPRLTEDAEAMLVEALARRLQGSALRALVLELHIAGASHSAPHGSRRRASGAAPRRLHRAVGRSPRAGLARRAHSRSSSVVPHFLDPDTLDPESVGPGSRRGAASGGCSRQPLPPRQRLPSADSWHELPPRDAPSLPGGVECTRLRR